MRLPLVICSLCIVFARGAARKDFNETCLFKKSCVLPCRIPEALSEVVWSKDMLAVQWFPPSESYHHHSRYRNRTSLFVHEIHNGNCSLMINDVKPEDSGIHKCDHTSQSRKEESFYYNLTVNAPVEEVVIEQFGDALICSSKQVHPKPECRWSGTILNSTVQQDNQLLYSITCITPLLHNVSHYNCTVSTPFSSKRATYTQLPPITISGTEASLHCGPSVGPVKTVSWRFNHSDTIVNQSSWQQVSEGWRPFVRSISESGDLRLENLTSHQQGLFTCITSTDTETYTATMWLEMKESLSLCINTVITAVFTATVLTFLTLSAYRCFQTTSEAPASDPQTNRSQSRAAVPQDRFRALQIICGLLGLGSGLPCHFFVTASLYLKQRMDNQSWVLSLVVLVSVLPHLISEVFNSFFVFKFSQRTHTSGCLVMISLIFVAMSISIKVQMAGETFFGISMCALWLASLFSSMVQRSLCIEVNLLPIRHRQSFAHGQAFAGVLASLVMIVCVAVTEDTDLTVFCHFSFAFVVSVAALITYWVLQHHEFAKYHFNKERQIREESSFELVASKNQNNNNNSEHPHSTDSLLPNWIENLCAGFCVALVPILTFSVYPAITADVHSVNPGDLGRYFTLVCCFLIFNFCKFIGQIMAMIFRVHKHFLIVFPVVVIHTAFIPWFMFCNVQPRAFLPVDAHVSNDTAFTFSMVLFSFCDGFLTYLSLLYEPNSERDGSTGSSKILWNALGGTIGALISFAVRALI